MTPPGVTDGGSGTDDTAVVDAVVAAVLAVPGVADLHGGMFGEVGTYLPGRRVRGIRLTADRVEVHVTATWEVPVRVTAEAVAVAAESVAHRPAQVTVEDLADPVEDLTHPVDDRSGPGDPTSRIPSGTTSKEPS